MANETEWRVWPKDEFDACRDADERDDGAMELRIDRSVWSITRIGRVLHCPYSIDDAGEAAEYYADYFHSQRDGWECTWPIEFVVHDGSAYVVVEVERDMCPEFRGGRPKPLIVDERPRCTCCESEIDPDTCHCGEATDAHNIGSGHSPVPMGCTCHLMTTVADGIAP